MISGVNTRLNEVKAVSHEFLNGARKLVSAHSELFEIESRQLARRGVFAVTLVVAAYSLFNLALVSVFLLMLAAIQLSWPEMDPRTCLLVSLSFFLVSSASLGLWAYSLLGKISFSSLDSVRSAKETIEWISRHL